MVVRQHHIADVVVWWLETRNEVLICGALRSIVCFSGYVCVAATAEVFVRGFFHNNCGVIDFLFNETSLDYFLTQTFASESRWKHSATIVRMDAETSDR